MHAHRRRVEVIEACLHHLHRHLGADAGEGPAFLERDQAVGLAAPSSTMVSVSSGRSVRRLITSALDALLGQLLGRLHRHADHDARRRRW